MSSRTSSSTPPLIFALHAWFACNIEKYQKTCIAWNVEQFVGALHVLSIFLFEIRQSLLKFFVLQLKAKQAQIIP